MGHDLLFYLFKKNYMRHERVWSVESQTTLENATAGRLLLVLELFLLCSLPLVHCLLFAFGNEPTTTVLRPYLWHCHESFGSRMHCRLFIS